MSENPPQPNPTNESYARFTSFKALFEALGPNVDEQTKAAYDEAVGPAQDFVADQDRSSWDRTAFQTTLHEKYPDLPEDLILAFSQCVEHYNPPVNLPEEPLW